MEILKKNKIDVNIWKITLLNIRIIFSPTEYKKWGENYFRTHFTFINWNLKTSLHFIPFFVGCLSMIWSRYENQTLPSIFAQTLPGTKLNNEKLSWETFKLFRTNLDNKKDIKKIDIYPTYYVLNINKKNKQKLTGVIFPKQQISKNYPSISSENQAYLNFDENSNFNDLSINNIFYNLDELPLKIEEIKLENVSGTKKSIFSKKLKKIFKSNPKLKTEINKISKNQIGEIKILFDKKNESQQINISKGIGLKKLQLERDFDKKLNPCEEKITKKEITTSEINALFYNDGLLLTPVPENFSIENPNFSFLKHCPIETIELLQEFLPLYPSTQDGLRKVSGYQYPDLTRTELYSLNLQTSIKKNIKDNFLTIELPSNFLASTNDLSLININSCKSLPITARKKYFFGANKIYRRRNRRNLNSKNLNSRFLAIKNDVKKGFQIEQLGLESILENKSKIKILSNKDLSPNTEIIYHFPEFTENFLIQKTPPATQIGAIYKRLSPFPTTLNENRNKNQNQKFSFFQCWEPISINSWLLVTQFSMGLFLLHLVKDLYKDYGRELVEYSLEYASSSGVDIEEIKEQYLYEETEYRLIHKVKKNFIDIAGIDKILLEIGEMVWFLRNKGRSAKLKNSIPSGILLTGPPGTGKTLLVQAIAGEAQVPIIVESGSLLTDPQQQGKGIERLKKIFDHARKLSPCIVFIDEVDTLGEKRQNIIQTTMGNDELIESIYEKNFNQTDSSFLPKPLNLEDKITEEKDLEYQLFRNDNNNSDNSFTEQTTQINEAKKTRLSLLTQFLIEMDGLKQRQGVIVIGATNRPNVLDPALIRPGRFDKIINLELPGKQKRIEILKLYSKNIQTEKNISWDYLANRTKGFSAADIAAAMNESTIKSIIKKTTHTIETIEYGIDLVTSYNTDPNTLDFNSHLNDPFFRSRLAYYQSGKALLQTFLENHPPVVVLHLWPRQKNARHERLYVNQFSEKSNRKTLEAQLIGLYAGKASELVSLYGTRLSSSLKRWHSNLGNEDLLSATFLANLLVDKWYFYSLQILIRKNNLLLDTRNEKEFSDIEKTFLANSMENEVEDDLEIEKIAKLSRLGRYQQRGFGPWWQIQVAKQTGEIESFFAEWYRLYISDPEENILNLEWLPPDEYYHTNDSLKNISNKSTISFNELYKIERDYVFHGLLLNSFNFAFDFVEEKREFLDYFSDYLLRFEILRENEIQSFLNIENNLKISEKELLKSQTIQTLEKGWGQNSRRKTKRFLNIESGLIEKTSKNYKSPFLNF